MPAFKKSKGGRPPIELTEELIAKVCQALRAGAYVETACVVSGISKSLFYLWSKKAHNSSGARKTDIYGRFLDAVEKAQEECTVRDLANIDRCAMGQEWEYERDEQGRLVLNARGNPIPKKVGVAPDWQASAWRLERRRPKEWSKTEKVEMTGKDGGPQVIVNMPGNGREEKPEPNKD